MRSLFLLTLLMTGYSSDVLATTYAFCKGGAAFSDEALRQRAANLDYICQMKSEADLGLVAGTRCAIPQKGECEIGAGGDPAEPGDHNVKRNAWFRSYSTAAGQSVKCQCGCFHPSMRLMLGDGSYQRISDILETSKNSLVSFSVKSALDEKATFTDGLPINATHFTVGPEKKPLVRIVMSNGQTLLLTSKHPVVVLGYDSKRSMVKAEDLRSNDVLIDANGDEVYAVVVERVDSNNVEVINFEAPDKNPASHIVLAEGVQVGDNFWQQVLSDAETRLELRFDRSTEYLSKIRERK